MKKVINAGIGGRSFVMDEDAYQRLELYLTNFRRKADMGYQTTEMMEELEGRIAELITESLRSRQEVVSISLVNQIVSQLGMPDGTQESVDSQVESDGYNDTFNGKSVRKFYRDPDHKALGGVCGGLAAFFDIDVLLVRVAFLIALFLGSLGFWLYVVLWIVAPLARTPAQKCEMRGLPVTAENMKRYSNYNV